MLSSLGVAPVSGISIQIFILIQKYYFKKKCLDVLSSLTTSPNKSELYNLMSTPDSSAKGSLPQTPLTW